MKPRKNKRTNHKNLHHTEIHNGHKNKSKSIKFLRYDIHFKQQYVANHPEKQTTTSYISTKNPPQNKTKEYQRNIKILNENKEIYHTAIRNSGYSKKLEYINENKPNRKISGATV